MSDEYTESQLRYRRSKGVNKAWERERELVRRGRGTREWDMKEQKQLLKTGRVKGYQGHHMKSVSKYPQYADDPKNIQFLSARKENNEHLKAHKGDYRNESNGRYNVKSGKIRPMNEGNPRAMNSYELKNKAIEKRGYQKYASDKNASARPSASDSRSKGAKTASAKTVYNGKTYNRDFVKNNSRVQTKSSGQNSKKAAGYGAKSSSGRSAAQGTGNKGGNYGKKTSAASSSGGQKSAGGYGKSRASGQAQGGGRSSGSSSGHGRSSSSGGSSSGHSRGGSSGSRGASHGR